MLLATALWTFLHAWLFGSAAIALENLARRHQLVVLQRAVPRPRLTRWDRIFWVWLSRLWASWRSSLVIVQPATVLAWHRKGFQLYTRSCPAWHDRGAYRARRFRTAVCAMPSPCEDEERDRSRGRNRRLPRVLDGSRRGDDARPPEERPGPLDQRAAEPLEVPG
jgi:hypothetical protein